MPDKSISHLLPPNGIYSPVKHKSHPKYKVAFVLIGGERGIRTLDTVLPYTHFPGVLLQPLGHLSKYLAAADLARRARLYHLG